MDAGGVWWEALLSDVGGRHFDRGACVESFSMARIWCIYIQKSCRELFIFFVLDIWNEAAYVPAL